MTQVVITETAKGHRIWIQGLAGKGITRPFFTVAISEPEGTIDVVFGDVKAKGWRKVTQAKGGIVDLCSNKVTKWAQGATVATVTVVDSEWVQIKRGES